MGGSQDQHDDRTRKEELDWASRILGSSGRDAPRRMAEWLLMEVLCVDRGQLYAHAGRRVASEARSRFESMVERCAEGEPLQHVLGYTSFRGLRIDVSPAVMIPRPETEEVVDAALEMIDSLDEPTVLDIGTGSGCIAISMKHERPEATVEAWDVSPEALAIADENARRHNVEIRFEQKDLFDYQARMAGSNTADLLVSNPPYIPDDEAHTLPAVVRDYDPAVALFSGEDPLRFYQALADRAPKLCEAGGAVVLEIHAEYAEETADLFESSGYDEVRIDTDLSERPRILTARIPA